MDYKEVIVGLIYDNNVNNTFDLYRVIHKLEIKEFEDAFLKCNKDSVCFENKRDMPMITITAHEEPLQMLVMEIRKERDSVVVVCDYYGDINAYNLHDVEYGHLDFLKDYLC